MVTVILVCILSCLLNTPPYTLPELVSMSFYTLLVHIMEWTIRLLCVFLPFFLSSCHNCGNNTVNILHFKKLYTRYCVPASFNLRKIYNHPCMFTCHRIKKKLMNLLDWYYSSHDCNILDILPKPGCPVSF